MQLTLQAMKTLSELMDSALELDGETRSRSVADLSTGPHAALQPLLADMLAKQADMETAFLVSPITLPDALPLPVSATVATLATGTRIGPYVLQREVGHGGMGAVWLADRVDGALTRQVALKLPTIHLTDALAERFARERDILAQLTHPNIARLYDAGVSDSGRPYLALEYVQGKPITEHCDAIKLSIHERLQRFLQVASAVQYAHANLVIHRDLKPGNILVSEDGQVHLLDFGIAKLLDDPKGQAAESELTMIAGRALTLDYASPEQVNGSAISTASDVYSMGVVLYQLLTGQKPYQPHQLKRGTRAELEEAITNLDPERMSDAVRRGEQTIADQRSTSRDRLARALAGDLDTIVGKAMKKDPQQRYATVAAFAQDIERHLDGLPVEAQPDSWRYRTGKFVARNRLGVAASLAVALALTAGLGTALWQANVATQQALRADAAATTARDEKTRADAEAQTAKQESERADAQAGAAVASALRADAQAVAARQEALRADRETLAARREATRADQEARLARVETTRGNAVQGYLVDLFSANSNDQKNAIQVRNLTAKQLLDRGAEKLESNSQLPTDVNAALYRLFGELYETVYDEDRAVQMHERGAKAAEAAYGKQSKQYALALLELAWVLRNQKSSNSRIDLIEEAKTILARVAPGGEEYAQALYFEASFVVFSDPSRAARAAEASVRLMDANGGSNRRKAFAQRSLGYARRALGDYERAAVSLEQAARGFEGLYGADAMEVGLTRSILAECHRQQLRLVEAEAVARSSLEILRPFRGKQVDSDVHGQRVLRLMADRGRIGEAEKKSQEIYDELAGNANRPREAYAAAGLLLADFAAARGDTDRAGQLLAPHRNAIPGGSHIAHTSVLLRIARMELLLGNLTEAKQAVAAAKTLQRDRGLPIDFALGLAAIAAEVAAAEGQSESALAEYADFLKRFPMPKYSPATQLALDMSKARVFTTLKRWSDAEALLRDWVGKALLPGQELPVSANGEALLLAGEAALNLGKPGAAKLLQAAGEILQKHDVVNSSRLVRLNAAMLRLGGSP